MMLDRTGNKILSKVGSIVMYTGNMSGSFDPSTTRLMFKKLKPGRFYEVIKTGQYGYKERFSYYRFKGISGYYPCSSFIETRSRDFVKIRYDFR